MEVDLSSLRPYRLAGRRELNLDVCLGSGQTFSWTRHADKYWVNALDGELLVLSTDDRDGDDGGEGVFFWTLPEQKEAVSGVLRRYFRLDVDLQALYGEWRRDRHFASLCDQCPGVRLLDQPSFESLLSFICSQNNGIKRITSMVRVLKEHFGGLHAIVDGTTKVHIFPSPAALADPRTTEMLRERGFGYRARYIQAVSARITDGLFDLAALRAAPYEVVFAKLTELVGVGPKVADCIALTGLGQMGAVPVDTHIWRVARTHYAGMPSGTTLTIKAYRAIGDRFRSIFGDKAGWAHLVLFAIQIRVKK